MLAVLNIVVLSLTDSHRVAKVARPEEAVAWVLDFWGVLSILNRFIVKRSKVWYTNDGE